MAKVAVQVITVVLPYDADTTMNAKASAQLDKLAMLLGDGYELIASSTVQASNAFANVYTLKKEIETEQD